MGFQDDSKANLSIKARDKTPLIEVTPESQDLTQLTWQVSDHLGNFMEEQVNWIETGSK